MTHKINTVMLRYAIKGFHQEFRECIENLNDYEFDDGLLMLCENYVNLDKMSRRNTGEKALD